MTIEIPDKKAVKGGLTFLGDCFFHSKNGENPFGRIGLEADQTVVVNCETTLMETGSLGRENNFKLIQTAKEKDALSEEAIAACDILCLANNHTLDLGDDGIEETQRWILQKGKAAIGTIEMPYTVVDIQAYSVAIVSSTAFAGRKYSRFPRAYRLIKTIINLRKRYDFVIVTVHWGMEYADHPSPRQRKIASRLIESGADLIIGHHPHVYQGCETIQGKPVYYSLGNANFGTWQNRYSQWSRVGMMVKVGITDGMLTYQESFFDINQNYVLELHGEKQGHVAASHFEDISEHRLRLGWLEWGMRCAETFWWQEREAFAVRFKEQMSWRQIVVLLYWLSKPLHLFLLFALAIKRTTARSRPDRAFLPKS